MSTLTHTPFAELSALTPPPPPMPAPVADTRMQSLEPVFRALRTGPDTRLLVIGGQPRNFSSAVLDSPRVVIWHSDDRRVMRNSRIPSDVVAVVSTRWTDHAVMGHVRREAQRIGAVVLLQHLTPNAIETLLQAVGIIPTPTSANPLIMKTHAPVKPKLSPVPPPKPVPAPVVAAPAPVVEAPTPAPRRPITARKDGAPSLKAGVLKAWLIKNVGRIKDTADVVQEAKVLLPRLKAEGIETTHVSLTTTMYRLRKEQRGDTPPVRTVRGRNRPNPTPAVAPTKPAEALPVAPATTPVASTAVVHTETTVLQKKLTAILSLIEEQQAALSVIRDEIHTVQPMLLAADAAATELPILRRRFERLQAVISETNW